MYQRKFFRTRPPAALLISAWDSERAMRAIDEMHHARLYAYRGKCSR
jgi:hypothetical protein